MKERNCEICQHGDNGICLLGCDANKPEACPGFKKDRIKEDIWLLHAVFGGERRKIDTNSCGLDCPLEAFADSQSQSHTNDNLKNDID